MQVIITTWPRWEVVGGGGLRFLLGLPRTYFTMANIKNEIRSYQVLERT